MLALLKTALTFAKANPVRILADTGLVVLVLGIVHIKYSSYHYNKGKLKCESQQVKVDNEVKDTLPDFQEDIKTINEEQVETREVIKETHFHGFTKAQIDLAKNEGRIEGQKEGRNEVYAQITEQGGCLVSKYDSDDRLLINAKRQQQNFIKRGIGSFGGSKTSAELYDGESGASEVSEGLAGEYP